MTTFAFGDLFTGKLIRLAARDAEFKEAAARWSNDAEYGRLFNFDPAVPRSLAFFEGLEKTFSENPNRFDFGFRTLADNKLIGFGGLGAQWSHQSAWLWIGIGDADNRGKGYGTDALRLLLGYAFRELNLHRVSLSVFGNNPRAIHVYEKVGFVHEGVNRAALYRDGQRFDSLAMGILRCEWEAQVNGGG